MKVCTTKKALKKHLKALREKGLRLGLVPTMGALHQGHLSLIEQAVRENDACIVSIFVNPIQFNDPTDLDAYPRTPEKDLALAEEKGADFIFMPGEKEMYPEPDQRIFDLGGLDLIMEGKHRPGHFVGVARVVSKLFELCMPDRAYFGQKDFQQLAIIKYFSSSLFPRIEVIGCPIIREKDGLAMSSRNTRLNEKDRESATFIYRTLCLARDMQDHPDPEKVRAFVTGEFNKRTEFKLEYFEIVDSLSLKPVSSLEETGQKIACIAVILGGVRLIDNVIFD